MGFVEHTDPLWKVVAEIAEAEDLVLYDLERVSASQIKVTIDKPRSEQSSDDVAKDSSDSGASLADKPATSGKASGVTSGDCSRLVRRLMILFTAEGPKFGLTHEPQIEVSSPGINRLLRLPEHFRRAVGERVKILSLQSRQPNQVALPVVGKVLREGQGNITVRLEENGQELVLPIVEIKKAHVEFAF